MNDYKYFAACLFLLSISYFLNKFLFLYFSHRYYYKQNITDLKKELKNMYTISYFKVLDYPKDGRRINGVSFHLVDVEETKDENAYGHETLQIYIPAEKIAGEVSVGAVCELCYSVVRGKARITGIKIS